MSCNSAINTVNQTNQTVVTEAGTFVQVPFGSVVRRFGRNLRLDGDSINACGYGYYDVECSIVYTPTVAGPVTARIMQDSNVVPGLLSTNTGTVGDPMPLFITGLIRNCGCDCNSNLTLWIDAPGNITNCSCKVVKR